MKAPSGKGCEETVLIVLGRVKTGAKCPNELLEFA